MINLVKDRLVFPHVVEVDANWGYKKQRAIKQNSSFGSLVIIKGERCCNSGIFVHSKVNFTLRRGDCEITWRGYYRANLIVKIDDLALTMCRLIMREMHCLLRGIALNTNHLKHSSK